MSRPVAILLSLIPLLHGLIHLMGTVVYMRLGTIQGLDYKTSLLGGRWAVGEIGMRVFGVFWAVAALGFVVGTVAWWAGWETWRPFLIGITLFSLVLTALDWTAAYAGVVLNVTLLILFALGPRLGFLPD